MAYPDLYLMRHGQTEWNVEERMQGRADSPLTALGRAQAGRLADLARDVLAGGEVALYASSQGRAQETARIVFGDAPFHSDDRLVEIDVGDFTGARLADLYHSHPHLFTDEGMSWYDRTPNGEDFAALYTRTRSFLDDLTGPAMIVTHGVTLKMLRVVAMGLPLSELDEGVVAQGAIYRIANGFALIE